MRVERRQGSDERRVLTGMIVDSGVLGRIAARWNPKGDGLFASKWANLVAGWSVQYYTTYGEAPKAQIESLFNDWAERQTDDETVDLVNRFLSSISDDYEAAGKGINPAYVIDLAGRLFNRVKTTRLVEAIQADLDLGGDGEASKRIAAFSRVELGGGEGVDLFNDTSVIEAAFAESTESLVKYPGSLGQFFGDVFCRDSLVSFMGPEKRGKTWWLIDLAFRAVQQRRKVAFFEVGDMSLNQIARRFAIRAARQPRKSETIQIPVSLEREVEYRDEEEETPRRGGRSRRQHTQTNSEVGVIVKTESREVEGLTLPAAKEAFAHLMQKQAKSKEQLLRLSCHPNSSISVTGIKARLLEWERENWVPDLILIDYADILAPPTGQMESRDAINATWKQMRALSQESHCCVATATQADASSYNAGTLGMGNFSEDKRKYAHVTAMIGLNATDDEKRQGRMRLNYLVLREDEFVVDRCIHVAGCLKIGNPAMFSTF